MGASGKVKHGSSPASLPYATYSDDSHHEVGDTPDLSFVREWAYVLASSDADAKLKAQADYVCEGVTGHHTDINNAISYVTESDVKGAVLLVGNKFYLSGKVTLAGNCAVIGAGWHRGAPTLYLVSGSNPADIIGVATGAAYSDITLMNLLIDGNRSGNTDGRGINATGFNNFNLKSVIVQNGQTITITYSSVPSWTWYGL